MNSKQFLTGTVVGGVVLYGLGYVIFVMLLGDFYAANAGGATGVMRESEIIWAGLVGTCGYAALICYAMGPRAPYDLAGGAKIGAIVGFLLWFSVDFAIYGFADISNLTRTIVDPLFELVRGGVGGAVIGLIAEKTGASA